MKKQIIVGVSTLCVLSSVLSLANIKDNNHDIKLARDKIQFKDTKQVAINISEDGENYVSSNTVPTGAYEVNTERSKCRIPTDTLKGENAPADNNVTIEYLEGKLNFRGLTTQNTKCYIYLNKLDTEIPVISNVTTSVTQTSITVNVTAADNKEVTEYWYQIDTNPAVKGTGSSHTFSGLSAETSHTINVYVKDAAGNVSETTTKTVTTAAIPDTTKPTISDVSTSVTQTSITLTVSASDNKGVTEYYYQLGSNTPVSKTSNSHTFSGLSAGTSYTINVYVKDAAGNQSTTTTKTVTTLLSSENTLAKLNITNYKTTRPTFSNAATTDEGVYRTSDGMYEGYSYYWRGAATTNHVIFANKCWRIVRINGDGSIRLIYNGTVLTGNKCTGNGSNAGSNAKTSIQYNSSYDNSSYVGWTYNVGSQRTLSGTASNIKKETESWFTTNITGTNANKVADGKFCNDRNPASGSSWSSQPSSTFYYAGQDRKNGSPTLACPTGDVYTLKVGTITMDELVMAGAKWGIANSSYYLYNGQYYWTMSPYYWYYYNLSNRWAGVFVVWSDGQLNALANNGVGNNYGMRPVINLKADTQFSGSGTQDNPYIVQ